MKRRLNILNNIGLVLEGGGMRGVYTGGVLDFFIDKDLYFPYVIGVSAGACNASSYISKQKERNKKVTIGYCNDHRYLGYRNLIKYRSIFNMKFLFDEIPNNLVPFDFDTFNNSPQRFVIGTTDCISGNPVYYEKGSCDILTVLQASSSLPMLAKMVHYNNLNLLDGGVSDPIPIKKSISDGNTKNIIVLTRNKGYRKTPFKFHKLAKRMYPNYQGILEALSNRHRLYNATMDYIDELEKENKVFVIRPTKPLTVDRIEKNPDKLTDLYQQGYQDTKDAYSNLKAWLELD
jgi:predicted patatin/cPLA2 family phospholipase